MAARNLLIGTEEPRIASGPSLVGDAPAWRQVVDTREGDRTVLDGKVDDIFVFDDALDPHQVNAIRNLRLSALDYSPAEAAALFDLFEAGDTGIVKETTWEPVSGLDASTPGRLDDPRGQWAGELPAFRKRV